MMEASPLVDVHERLYGGDQDAAPHLMKLRRIAQRLIDATFTAHDQGLEVLLAGLEHETRLCKQEIERRLGVRN